MEKSKYSKLFIYCTLVQNKVFNVLEISRNKVSEEVKKF